MGRASALALLRDGWAVGLAGRRAEALEETRERAGEGAALAVIPTDITDPDAVSSLFARVVDEFGRLDLLFNNAGSGARPILLEDLPLEQWQAVVDVNLTASFVCTQERSG